MSLASFLCRITGHRYGPWRLERQSQSWTLVSACDRCLAVRSCDFPLTAFGGRWYRLLAHLVIEEQLPPELAFDLLGRLRGTANTATPAPPDIHRDSMPPSAGTSSTTTEITPEYVYRVGA